MHTKDTDLFCHGQYFKIIFIQCYLWNGTEINSFNLVSLQVIFSTYIIVNCQVWKLEPQIYSLSQSIFSEHRILNLNPLAMLEFAHNLRQSWNSKRCFLSPLRSHYFMQFNYQWIVFFIPSRTILMLKSLWLALSL